MGIGSARGEDRAVQAAELAISSPLLEASIDGAHGVLLSVQGGSDLGLFEINEAARLVQEAAHPEANIIFGAVIDDALGDEVRVTVIAAGFDSGGPSRREDANALGSYMSQRPAAPAAQTPTPAPTNGQAHPVVGHQQGHQQPVQSGHSAQSGVAAAAPAQPAHPAPQGQPHQGGVPSHAPAHQAPAQPVPAHSHQQPPRQVTFEDNDELDVPDFLK
jgi:cell division protein FtsZ